MRLPMARGSLVRRGRRSRYASAYDRMTMSRCPRRHEPRPHARANARRPRLPAAPAGQGAELAPRVRAPPRASTSAPAATTTAGSCPSRVTLARRHADPAPQGRRGPARRPRRRSSARTPADLPRGLHLRRRRHRPRVRRAALPPGRAKACASTCIYDSFGSRGSAAASRRCSARCAATACGSQQFHPMRPWECQFSWRPVNRDHRKLLMVDDDIAGMGGLNVGAEYAGSWVGRSGGQRRRRWDRDGGEVRREQPRSASAAGEPPVRRLRLLARQRDRHPRPRRRPVHARLRQHLDTTSPTAAASAGPSSSTTSTTANSACSPACPR